MEKVSIHKMMDGCFDESNIEFDNVLSKFNGVEATPRNRDAFVENLKSCFISYNNSADCWGVEPVDMTKRKNQITLKETVQDIVENMVSSNIGSNLEYFRNYDWPVHDEEVKLKTERIKEEQQTEELLDFAKDLAESIRKNKAIGEPWHPTDDWQIVDKLYDYAKTANLVNEKAIGKALAAVSKTPALENQAEYATQYATLRISRVEAAGKTQQVEKPKEMQR